MTNWFDIVKWVAVLGVAAGILRWSLWRAVLCVAPSSMKIDSDAPADQMKLPDALKKQEAELLALGFVPVGRRYEKPVLSQETLSYDYAHPGERAFATLYRSRRDDSRLYFITQTQEGAFVITANYRRPAREIAGRYFSGVLEHLPTDRIYKAHVRRVAAFGTPISRLDQEGRLETARAWFAGPGKLEVRMQNLHGLLWSLTTLGMVLVLILTK